jgi:hypothetical protein
MNVNAVIDLERSVFSEKTDARKANLKQMPRVQKNQKPSIDPDFVRLWI